MLTLLRFLAEVVKERCIAGEVEQAHLPIAVGVERGFEAAQRHGGQFEDFTAPVESLLLKLSERDDLVDQAHVESLLCVVLAAEKPNLPGAFLSDNAREVAGAEAAIERSDARAGLTEPRIVRRDGQIADHMQNVTAANGITGHHGHDGFGQAADLLLHIEDIETRNAIGADVAAITAHLLVATGAEGFVPLAREDDHTDRGVVAAMIERILHFLHGLRTEGITDFGTVDRDLGNAVVRLLELQIGVIFDFVPDRNSHTSYTRGLRDPSQERCDLAATN